MFKKYDKVAYIITLSLLSVFVLMSCFPALSAVGGFVTPPVALFVGLVYALLFGKPFASFNKKMSKVLLQYSVVGLGFGMNLYESLASGSSGMLFTIVSVFGTLAIGWFIGRKLLGVDRNISYLISSGTAICGGSAIAAVGPVIKAKDNEMSAGLKSFIPSSEAHLVLCSSSIYVGHLVTMRMSAAPSRDGRSRRRPIGIR